MNPDYNQLLETQIDRELKALPNLTAPANLRARVLAAIEPQVARRAAWSAWPISVRFAVLVLLVTGFAGLCYAAWNVRDAAFLTLAGREMGRFWSVIDFLRGLVETLGSAIVLTLKSLNGAILVSLIISAALAYFLWVALGTLWFRIAFARR